MDEAVEERVLFVPTAFPARNSSDPRTTAKKLF